MKWIAALSFFILSADSCIAGELNLGFHISPLFNLPIISGKSSRNEDIRIGMFRPGIDAGINVNYKLENLSIELSPSYIGKSVSIFNRSTKYSGQNIYYRGNFSANCLSLPLSVNFLLDKHDEKTRYDMYLTAGLAYEMDMYSAAPSSSQTERGGVLLSVVSRYEGPVVQHLAVAQLGLKVNAILRNVGLVDYGMSLHIPFSNSGVYKLNASLSTASNNTSQSAGVYAMTSHLTLRFTYYFLSLGSKFKRTVYRVRV